MGGASIDELRIGARAELAKTYDEWDIYTFAALTGDLNPAHVDPDFAARSIFRGRIAHGMLTASLISAAIGMKLPGTGSIYLSQELRFLRPVRIGDTVTATIEVVELVREKNLARLKTTCTSQTGELLLDGTALVMPPKVKVVANAPPPAENTEGARAAPSDGRPPALDPASRPKHGLLVGQRMTPHPVTISPDGTLLEARALLDQGRIRHLPVVEAGRLVGMLSDRDIYQASLPGGEKEAPETEALLSLIRVREVMARDVATIGPTAGVGEASARLVAQKVGALPVLEGDRLVGILTVIDALEALVEIAGG